MDPSADNSGDHLDNWWEISALAKTRPRVMCVLPTIAVDLVASSLATLGSRPVLPEDSEDVKPELEFCNAVIVDTSARREMVEALEECLTEKTTPIILSLSKVGSSESKCSMAQRIAEDLCPVVISGKMPDIIALAKAVCSNDEESCKPLNHSDSIKEELKSEHEGRLSPLMPRSRPRSKSPARYRSKSPQPGGVQDKLHQKSLHSRTPTPKFSGVQFRDGTTVDMSVADTTFLAKKLAARTKSIVHIHDTAVITSGEKVVELHNYQMGMNLGHPGTACISASVIGSVVGVLEAKGEVPNLVNVGHAVALFAVAVEKAEEESTSNGAILPGSMKFRFFDALSQLNVPTLIEKAKITQSN